MRQVLQLLLAIGFACVHADADPFAIWLKHATLQSSLPLPFDLLGATAANISCTGLQVGNLSSERMHTTAAFRVDGLHADCTLGLTNVDLTPHRQYQVTLQIINSSVSAAISFNRTGLPLVPQNCTVHVSVANFRVHGLGLPGAVINMLHQQIEQSIHNVLSDWVCKVGSYEITQLSKDIVRSQERPAAGPVPVPVPSSPPLVEWSKVWAIEKLSGDLVTQVKRPSSVRTTSVCHSRTARHFFLPLPSPQTAILCYSITQYQSHSTLPPSHNCAAHTLSPPLPHSRARERVTLFIPPEHTLPLGSELRTQVNKWAEDRAEIDLLDTKGTTLQISQFGIIAEIQLLNIQLTGLNTTKALALLRPANEPHSLDIGVSQAHAEMELQLQAVITSTTDSALVAPPLKLDLNMSLSLTGVEAAMEIFAGVSKAAMAISDPLSRGLPYLAAATVALNVTQVTFNVSDIQLSAGGVSDVGGLLNGLGVLLEAIGAAGAWPLLIDAANKGTFAQAVRQGLDRQLSALAKALPPYVPPNADSDVATERLSVIVAVAGVVLALAAYTAVYLKKLRKADHQTMSLHGQVQPTISPNDAASCESFMSESCGTSSFVTTPSCEQSCAITPNKPEETRSEQLQANLIAPDGKAPEGKMAQRRVALMHYYLRSGDLAKQITIPATLLVLLGLCGWLHVNGLCSVVAQVVGGIQQQQHLLDFTIMTYSYPELVHDFWHSGAWLMSSLVVLGSSVVPITKVFVQLFAWVRPLSPKVRGLLLLASDMTGRALFVELFFLIPLGIVLSVHSGLPDSTSTTLFVRPEIGINLLCWSSLGMMLCSALQIHLHNQVQPPPATSHQNANRRTTCYAVLVATVLIIGAAVAFILCFTDDLVRMTLEGLVGTFTPNHTVRNISIISPLRQLPESTDATAIAHILLLFYSVTCIVAPTVFLVCVGLVWFDVAYRSFQTSSLVADTGECKTEIGVAPWAVRLRSAIPYLYSWCALDVLWMSLLPVVYEFDLTVQFIVKKELKDVCSNIDQDIGVPCIKVNGAFGNGAWWLLAAAILYFVLFVWTCRWCGLAVVGHPPSL